MNKEQLIEAIARRTGSTKPVVRRFVETFTDVVTTALCDEGSVVLRGIGSLSVRDRPERHGRNPATGQVGTLAAVRTVTFKSSGVLKARVNGR